MPEWTAFGAVTGLVLLLVLALARATSAAVTTDPDAGDAAPRDPTGPRRPPRDEHEEAADAAPGGDSADAPEVAVERDRPADERTAVRNADPAPQAAGREADAAASAPRPGAESNPDGAPERQGESANDPETALEDRPDGLGGMSTGMLLANVLVTHGGFALVIAGAAVLTSVPPAALGIAPDPLSTGLPALGYGIGVGLALYLANVAMAANLDRIGIEHSEALRTSLSPDSPSGWALLLGVALPLVAVFEELLFRAALIGGGAVGFGIDPWLLVVASSVAFALGHGMQGPGGVLVTGLLGGVLGAAFVVSNSLLLVVVAHYVVNAAEFVVAEWLDVDLKSAFRVGG